MEFLNEESSKHQADLLKREYLLLSCQTLEVCCFRILEDERKEKKATALGTLMMHI